MLTENNKLENKFRSVKSVNKMKKYVSILWK